VSNDNEYILSKDYYTKHNKCPRCKNDNCEQTTAAIFLSKYNPYRIKKDQNKAACICGWSGTVHDLIEKEATNEEVL